jgi:site-specific recombinase XerD
MQRTGRRQPKTLEWHQTALGLLQQYLWGECQCLLIRQITETHMRGWVAFLQESPTVRGARRSVGTIRSYARSARAFCQWLVRQRSLARTPFAHLTLPKEATPLFHPLEPHEWDRLLQACRPARGTEEGVEQAEMRNQALLWVLAQTGISTSEICGLRLCDMDRERGRLSVRGKGSRRRWVPLGQESLRHLLLYLDRSRLETAARVKRRWSGQDALFVSETGRPLTENAIALLFGRLRKRAEIRRKDVNPTVLCESFAVRYLQAGGDVFTLRELLGQEESAVVKRYLRMSK